MKTISKNLTNEIIIKNSRFICWLIKLNTNSNINEILESIKQDYPKATHYCYGYIKNNKEYSSDDKEPTGTAGPPILNVLKKENLNNILCVVIRYFGGIKLGAGGLIRAYTKSVTECLKNEEFKELENGYKIKIEFAYNQEKQITYLLNNSIIIHKEFNETITYICLINEETLEKLKKYKIEILEKIIMEKDK